MSKLVFKKNSAGNLPDGWTKFRFGDYLKLEYGKGLTKKNRVRNGKVPVYGSSGIDGYHSQVLIQNPCLIIGRKGNVGEIHYVEKPSWAIDTTYYLEKNSVYDLKFLFYLFSHMRLGQLDNSTTIPSLRRDDVHALQMILPPDNEQKRIVLKIEELFSLIEDSEKNLKETLGLLGARISKGKSNTITDTVDRFKVLRMSILYQAFEGKLVPQDPNDEPAEILLEKAKKEKQKIIKQAKKPKRKKNAN